MSGKLPPHRALRRHPLVGRPATLMSVVVALLALMSGAALAQTADFGDYTSFPSASSTVVTTLKIGATTDKESAATTNVTATGDDITGTDDEDGVTLPASIVAGSGSSLTVNVTNTTGSTVYLNVWIDYNNNGVLTDSGEQIAANTTIATGTSNSNRTVSFTVPATATLGSVGVRVRLTSTSSPGPDGLDGNGEVEDNLATIATAPTLGVGNLVWTDTNDNGRFDTGEGVSGVLVQLLNTSNTVVTSTTTDAAGLYQLTTTVPGTYYAKIPASEFASGKPLVGKYSRVGNGPDNGKDDDWDENGVDDAAPASNGIRSPNFTLTAGAEPTTGETGTDSSWDNGTAGRPSDANADLTIDFGFAICVQTNLITNGSFETANPTTLTFPDVFPTGGSAIAKTRTTASNADVANWSFDAGSYINDPTHATDGSRMVHLNSSGACAGQQFAVGSVISGLTQLAAGQVYTLSFDWAPFDPSAPNTPPAGNNTQIYTDFYYTNSGWTTSTFINSFADFYDTNTNDFLTNPRPLSTWASLDWRRCRYKFVLPPAPSGQNYLTLFLTAGGTTGKLLVDNVTLTVSCEQAVGSVGNLIFNDANGNRVKDATESGIDKALVHLYRRPATGSPVWVGSTYTSQGGRYLFSGMQPANYYVWVDSANFSATTPSWWQGGSIAGPLYNKLSSSSNANPNVTAAAASDDDVSEKGVDNAAPITNGIYSPDFALGVGTEPVSSVGGKETGAFNSLDDSVDSHGDMTIDFGFAPATAAADYGDYASFALASSTANSTLRIGSAATDSETIPTTNDTATGDDTTGTDDEDGVTVPTAMLQGASGTLTVNVTNSSGATAYLNVWIDFNDNGVLTDSGEQIAVNTTVATGTSNSNRTVNFTVPASAVPGKSGVRVRLTSTSSPGPDGLDGNGEVEDTTLFVGCIFPSNLTLGKLSSTYSQFATFSAPGMTAPITWSATGLPAGLVMDSAAARITGTPTGSAGAFPITVTAVDATSVSLTRSYTFFIEDSAVNLLTNGDFESGSAWTPTRLKLSSTTNNSMDVLTTGNPLTGMGSAMASNLLPDNSVFWLQTGTGKALTGNKYVLVRGNDNCVQLTDPALSGSSSVLVPGSSYKITAFVANTEATSGYLDFEMVDGSSSTVQTQKFTLPVPASTLSENAANCLELPWAEYGWTFTPPPAWNPANVVFYVSPQTIGSNVPGLVIDHWRVVRLTSLDFGDFSGFADASSSSLYKLRLGATVDAETAATTNATATGDDTNVSDDEDGVTMPASISLSSSVTIPVSVFNNTGSNAYLHAWIDFNNDGTLNDTLVTSGGERLETARAITTGTGVSTQNITFTVPASASSGTQRGARFRLTNQAVTTPTGEVGSGEVEDYVVTIAATQDFGDYAPFPSASSTGNATLRIGATMDVEGSATTNATATGDDTTGSDDEDGVTIPASITQGTGTSMTVNVTNTSGSSAYLNVWIDFNGNGVLTDSGEQVATNTAVATATSNSNKTVSFTVPAEVKTGTVGVRARLTSISSPGPDGLDGIGEVEDITTSIVANTDFGDYASFTSASSKSNGTLRLGALVDSEGSSVTNTTATGDDLDGTDDEDGVTVPASIAQGAAGSLSLNLTNTTGSVGYLNAWIDFNRNGVLTDAGEQVAVNTNIATGTSNASLSINFTAPVAASLGTAGVRVRLTSVTTPGPDGLDGNGEVEDYATQIIAPTTDFGDELDFADASSTANNSLRLGALVDVEGSSTRNAGATGDDTTTSDDEDGLTFPSVTAGQPVTLPVTVTNTTGTAGFLNVWIDYNNNGTLTDAGEQVATNVSVATATTNGTINLSFTIPTNAVTAATSLGSRFRITDVASPGPTGFAGIGEVEDHPVVILAPLTDFGDFSGAGDVSNTASTNLRLGALVDTEYASTRNATATGDDTAGNDDEDGVTLPAMTAGAPATVPVTVTNSSGAAGYLNAWIDFNNNGVFTDANEQIANNINIANGTSNGVSNLAVIVPAAAVTGVNLGVRVRITALSSPGATGAGGVGEVEDYVISIAEPTTDFGDFTTFGSASSIRNNTLKLGALIDTEYAQTVNTTATGDDITGSDDEDAVTFPSMTAGAPATIPVLVTNTSGAAANLNLWIDYNGNGVLTDAGEQIATNVSIPNGSSNITQNVSITVPTTVLTGVNLGARLRLTSTTSPGATGASGNGEVEDYIMVITAPTTDFGDFASFADASQGANPSLRLGATLDTEFVSTRNATATGDDTTGTDDEDGVVVPAMIAGQAITIPVTVTNTTGANGFLNAWIDFNNNGLLTDSGEQVAANTIVATGITNGVVNVSFTVPPAAVTGTAVGIRFRYSAPSGLGPTGANALAGEIEDYTVTIAAPTTDFGDFTGLGSASSTRNATLKLGALTDVEYAATTNATATGDDITGSDDEDAVTLPVLTVGAAATIPVIVTNTSGAAAFLNAWIDYNNNGVVTDAGEQIATNTSIANGSNNVTQNISITVPAGAVTGASLGVRFRLTSTSTPGATGASGNGEVEDYVVSIANPPLDYGDSSVLGSASSTVVGTLFLGTAVTDTEFVPTLNPTASGDDNTATDDEDGVSIPTLTAGAPGTITVTATNTTGVAAFLNAWIDFNNDGDVLDAGEQLATNTNVATGTSNGSIPLNFTVPATAVTGANVSLRFRLTSTSTPGITGTSGNGEVEDYVTTLAVPTTDFGDWNGAADASSIASSNLRMGSLADTEYVSTRNAAATGDDVTASDDEDGVTLAASYNLSAASSATVVTTNLSGAAAYLNAWIDFNNNGSFADVGEQIATNTLVANGTNGVTQTINFTVPAAAIPGQRGMRVRFTDVQNPTPVGAAGMGEVEDNLLTINCPTITLSPTTVPNGTVGATYTQTITAAGGTGPYGYLVSAGALPSGLNLSPAGVLSGTLTSASVANFTIRATDANGCQGIQAYTFTPVCLPISITPTAAVQGLINTAYTQTLNASGGTAPYGSWTVTAGTLPTGLTLSPAGVISGTPTVAASPATSITVRTTDAYGCQGTQVITLKICPVVTLNPTSLTAATVGSVYSQTLSGSGGTSPYLFSLSSGSLPAWASFDTNTGVISGTPNSTATANFIIRATDANGCSGTRAYSLTPACLPITITPASLTAALINAPYSQTVTPSAGTAPFVYAVASGALPTGLTLNTSTGLISGTPTSSATATFTISATDTYGCVGTSSAYTLTPQPNADFGDLSTFGSASSTRNTTLKLGALTDYEYVQTTNATATGDDVTGSDDEDGVTLPTGLIQGQTGLSVTVNVTNTSGAETYLNGWIDFNNNGVLTDAGEQIIFNQPMADGTNAANMTYTFNVPSNAAVATVGVRFRLTSIANPGSTGASGAGEVEDYRITIAEPEDHGDFSLFQDASSKLSTTLKMGDFTDAESIASTNLAATGDDLNNINDEDGTTVQAILVRGQAGVTVTINVTNLSGSPAYLNGWADFNNNGALTDTDEQIITDIVVPTGTTSDYQTFFFDVPATATLGNIGTRFRLTSVSAPGPVGASGNGEVEDYTTTIVVPSSNFRDYFYAIRSSGGTWYLDEVSVYNPNSATPTVSVTPGILNLNTATSGFNASATNAYMNGLALDWLNRRFYWNSTSSGSSGYNFQLNTAYYDNVTKTWSYQTVTGSNLSNVPFDTGTPNSSSSGSGAFPRAAFYAGDYYGGGQNNDNMVAWRLDTTGKALKTPAFNDYPNFFHLTQKFGGGDFVIRPQDGLLVTSTAVNNSTNTLFNQFMTDGFNPSGPAATSVNIDGQIPVSSNSAVQIAGVGGVTRMYGVSASSAALNRLDNYDTASPVAVRVGTLPTGSGVKYDDLSEGISSSVTSLGVKGIVYEDMNGLTNSTVDGVGSNVGGTLFAMLVDAAGNLVDSFPVKDDGTFILGGAAANTTYTVVLSTSSGSLGSTAPAADLPAGWMNTGEFLGSGAGSDGTVNGRLSVSIVNNGLVNAKFGISQAVSVGNLVWNDANNNGLKDVSESGIGGVTAQLWMPGSDNAIGGTGLAADTLIATTTSSGSGAYGFTNQLQGKYYICVTPPALYSFVSSTVVTTDNGVDNDNNGSQPGGRGAQVYSPVIDLAVGKEPGNLVSGGIDIDNTIDFGLLTALDFGDYSLFGSASSTLVTNLFMGSLIDAEYSATTNATATGDNITGQNDEDGATIPAAGVVQGAAGSMNVRVTNTSGSSAYMNVWIDYNNNGVLTDAGEQVATNTLIANGTSNATRTVNFTAPATAYIGFVGVRVRLTSTNSPGSVGSSGNGEVEDHLIEIQSPIDYGDFASFASAGSTMVNTIFMGTLVDTEPSSTTNAAATADDLDDTDDEDGVTLPASIAQGASSSITVNVTNTSASNARLSAWIDFNRNGVLTDAGEQIANDTNINKATSNANQTINFTVPLTATQGTAGVRVRLTDAINAASVGLVGSGEVEDYVVNIVCPTISLTPTLPAAYLSGSYTQTVTASNGRAPYTYTLQSGALPTGLSLATNGTITGTPSVAGSFTSTVLATDANGCTSTLTYTIPVRTFSVGNLVFEDSNNNGLKDSSEPGVAGAIVQLFSTGSDNAIGGTASAADTQIGSNITTTSTGAYLFTGLIAGNYYVKVTPPASYRYTGGTPATADNNVNNNNDGAQPGGVGTPLFSPVINLSPGAESATDGDTDTDTNLTVDFGLWSPLGVGNLVFLDYNNNGNYDDSEGIEGAFIQIFAQGANVATDSPVSVAQTDHKGRYYIDNLNPGSYFLHLPASQFATGSPLSGMVPMSSVVAGDDDSGQDLLPAATPATTGASTAVFALNIGQLPTGASESGFEGIVDDSFIDSNNDFTRDLGLLSASGTGFPQAMSALVRVTEPVAATEVMTANTFATWQATYADADDDDLYTPLLEYALDTDPANGASGAGKFRVISNDVTGVADVLLNRPAAGREDIIYTVEVSSDLKSWERLNIIPQTSIDSDGSQIVRYASIEYATAFAGQDRGFVRLKVALDADLNGSPEDSAVSPVQAFSRENFSVGQRSFSMPLVKAELYAGSASIANAVATLPVSVTLPSGAQLYLEDLVTGLTYEVDEAASNSNTLVLHSAYPSHASLPRIALRAHHMLAELLPADIFTSGSTEAEADRIMTFDPEANQFNVTWLSAEGWTHNETLAPHSAVLVHTRNAEVSVLLTGQVATSAGLKPSAGTLFISTGLAIPQSPAEAGLTVANGFRSAASPASASRLRLWSADSDHTATGYDSLFLMQSGDTPMWVRENAATQNDLSESSLLEPFHGFFLMP